jgi:hypothetical protein
MNSEKVFKDVKEISLSKNTNGYAVTINKKPVMELNKATNFEWRVTEGCAPAFTHLYFGNETNNDEFSFNISFNVPYDIRISNPDARCYIYITQSH